MRHDPELVAETRAWFVKASGDLGAAAHEFKAEPPFLADIVFHAQQTAEKAFKGFLAWHSTPFRKTHHLEELGEQCLRVDPTLEPLVEKALPLTKYAWMFAIRANRRNRRATRPRRRLRSPGRSTTRSSPACPRTCVRRRRRRVRPREHPPLPHRAACLARSAPAPARG